MRTLSNPLLASLTFAAACSSSSAVVKSDHDQAVDFSSYRTFAIAEEAGQLNALVTDGHDVGFVGGEVALDLKRMANEVIVEQMTKKGLQVASLETADLIVTYLVNIGTKPEVIAPDYRIDTWSGEAELGSQPIARGTVVVDMLDPEREQARSFLVWRGWASDQVDVEAVRNRRGERLKEALSRILSRYPN